MNINTTNIPPNIPTVQNLEPSTKNNTNTSLQSNTQAQTTATDALTLSPASINLANTSRSTATDPSNIDPQQTLNKLQNSIEKNPEQAITSQSSQITSQVVQSLLG